MFFLGTLGVSAGIGASRAISHDMATGDQPRSRSYRAGSPAPGRTGSARTVHCRHHVRRRAVRPVRPVRPPRQRLSPPPASAVSSPVVLIPTPRHSRQCRQPRSRSYRAETFSRKSLYFETFLLFSLKFSGKIRGGYLFFCKSGFIIYL